MALVHGRRDPRLARPPRPISDRAPRLPARLAGRLGGSRGGERPARGLSQSTSCADQCWRYGRAARIRAFEPAGAGAHPSAEVRLSPERPAAQHVGVAAPDRDLLGIEVLEQRLRVAPRGVELVADSREGCRPVALAYCDDAGGQLIEDVGVEVEIARDAPRSAGLLELP